MRAGLILPNRNRLLDGHFRLNLRHYRKLLVALLVAEDQERLLNLQFLILMELAWIPKPQIFFVFAAGLQVLNR